jgi:hypothetical protein
LAISGAQGPEVLITHLETLANAVTKAVLASHKIIVAASRG